MAKSAYPIGGMKLTVQIGVHCDPELKDILGRRADEAGVSLSEYIVQILAKEINRPDLAVIPRKKMGRPRKELALGK